MVESLPPSGDAASGGVQAASRDRGRAVRLQMDDGTIRELSMADYLWGVVAAEMPASFELEALKAQACAARTYTVVRQNSGSDKHPGADICEDSTCCQAYIEREAALARWGLNAQEYEEKISQAVEGTDGLGILYEGQPIQALFFSSAAGRTVDAVAVWGNSVDYLKSVDSPEGDEVPNYHSPGRSLLSAGPRGGFGRLPRSGSVRGALQLVWSGRPGRGRHRHLHPLWRPYPHRAGQVRVHAVPPVRRLYRDLGRGKFYLRRYWLRPRGRHEPVWSQRHGQGGEKFYRHPDLVLYRHPGRRSLVRKAQPSRQAGRAASVPVSKSRHLDLVIFNKYISFTWQSFTNCINLVKIKTVISS